MVRHGEQVRARPVAEVRRALVRGAQDVTRLVVPVECPGCHRWDVVLCDECAATLKGPTTRCEWDVPRLDRMGGQVPLPVWRVARYAGPVRGVVLAWKDGGRADLTPTLVAAVRTSAGGLGPVLGSASAGAELCVVPVPSTAGACRRRGADLVRLLAQGVVEGLLDAGVRARVMPVLAVRSGRRDQVGLGAAARGRNTSGSVRLRGRWTVSGVGVPHLLVDDVVTTGSTLAACEGALSAAGGVVLGAFVLAATPPPSSPCG